MKILSLVIVNYNTGSLLKECLQSIKETTKDFEKPQMEVVVVDNASTDNSLRLAKRINGVVFVQNNENSGFAKAANQGIRRTTGSHILLLNPDSEVKPNAINSLVEFAEKTPNAGIVGARLLNPNGVVQASVFHFPSIWRAVREFWLGQEGAYSKYTPEGDSPMMVDAVVGAAFLITPEAHKRVGLLNEKYFMYFEDLDYCRRVWKGGLKVYYLPSAEVVHHHGVSGKGISDEANQWRRLVPSSKLYHGLLKHHLINFVIWSSSKFRRIFKLRS